MRSSVDLGFRSVGAQVVQVPGLGVEVSFAGGEHLRVEVSSKFRRESVESELAACQEPLRRLPSPRTDR